VSIRDIPTLKMRKASTIKPGPFEPKDGRNVAAILNPTMKNKDLLLQCDERKAGWSDIQKWRGERGAINQRQSQVERHKDKMFDPHERVIGVDVKGLNEQVRAKQEKQLRDAAEDAKVNEEINKAAAIACVLEDRRRADVRMRDKALTKYWVPKKCPDIPKMHCDSKALSLRFHGEDDKKGDRVSFQKEQNREWLLQQMEEKRCREAQEREETAKYDNARLKMDCVALQMEAELREARKTMAKCYAGANFLMAGQKTDECDEDCDKRREIANLTLTSGFLPNPDSTGMDIHLNADLITRTRMTPQDRLKQQQLEADLKEQMKDVAMRKKMEEEDEKEKDAWLLKADRLAVLQQRKLDTISSELRKQRAKENQVLAHQQQEKANYEKCLYTNEPKPEFFDQFNKCRVR